MGMNRVWSRIASFWDQGPEGSAFNPGSWIAPLMVAGVVLSLVSIFASGIAFGTGYLLWAWESLRARRPVLLYPPFTVPLLLFLAAVMTAVIFSPDFSESVLYVKKLFKYFSIFLVFTYITRDQAKKAFLWVAAVAGASGAWGIGQYLWFKETDLLHRIDGFMSHWMTFSGQMMIVAVALTACLLVGGGRGIVRGRGRWVLLGILLVLLLANLATLTRGAWMGCAAGILTVLALVRFRWVLGGVICVGLLFLLLPSNFKDRFYSGFDRTDTTTRGRLELIHLGWDLIRHSPWTGVGPRLVKKAALENRENADFPEELYQHLHNNLIQIAAETGVPAALLWLFLWGKIAWDLFRSRKNPDLTERTFTVMALGSLVAAHFMGLFEYNLGDAEISILLLFVVTLPFALASGGGAAEAQGRRLGKVVAAS